jgi:hypothetical protein
LLQTAAWRHLPALSLWFILHVLLLVAYILLFVRYRRRGDGRSPEAWDLAFLVNVMGLFLLLWVAPAPSWFRLCTVSLPAMIVVVFLIRSPAKADREVPRMATVAVVILAVSEPLQVQSHRPSMVDLPSRKVAFWSPVAADMAAWLSRHTHDPSMPSATRIGSSSSTSKTPRRFLLSPKTAIPGPRESARQSNTSNNAGRR